MNLFIFVQEFLIAIIIQYFLRCFRSGRRFVWQRGRAGSRFIASTCGKLFHIFCNYYILQNLFYNDTIRRI